MRSDSNSNDGCGPTSEIVNKGLSRRPRSQRRNDRSLHFDHASSQAMDPRKRPDAQWSGDALLGERRYAADLAAGMRDAGLVVG